MKGGGKPGKVVTKTMCIRMPLIDVKIKSDLIKKSQKINCKRSQTVRKSASGSNFEIDLTNSFISQQFDMQDWVIVVFQTDRSNVNQNNCLSYFDHCKVKNIV